MNPELLRNLWIEITPQRLLTMPAVLGLVFAAAWLAEGRGEVAGTARIAAFGIGVLWGARQAAGAVMGEIAARTWDGQRASALSAWEMTWGKLLGAPAYAWYGVLLSLIVMVATGGRVEDAGEAIIATGLAHAAALFASLVLVALGGRTLVMTSLPHLAGIAAGLAPFASRIDLIHVFGWYGIERLDDGLFWPASAVLYWAWAVVGAWRLMMGELGVPQRPWAWPCFAAFAAGHVGGFLWQAGRIEALAAACLCLTALSIAAALCEPKRHGPLRHLLGGRLGAAPPSVQSLALAGVTAALLPLRASGLDVMPLAAVLFAARDIALIRLVSLGRGGVRGALASLVWLAVLYVVLPALLGALEAPAALALVVPVTAAGAAPAPPVAVAAPALQAIVLWLLLARRLGAAQGRTATSSARTRSPG